MVIEILRDMMIQKVLLKSCSLCDSHQVNHRLKLGYDQTTVKDGGEPPKIWSTISGKFEESISLWEKMVREAHII